MSENSDLNQLLLETMRIIARQEIEKSNRDITKTGIMLHQQVLVILEKYEDFQKH